MWTNARRRVIQKGENRRTPVCPDRFWQELIVDQQGSESIRYTKFGCRLYSLARALYSRQGQPRKPTYCGIIIAATLEFQANQTPQELLPGV